MNLFSALSRWGWSAYFESQWQHWLSQLGSDNPLLQPVRISNEEREHYRGFAPDGREYLLQLTGKFRHGAQLRRDLPMVGDWVVAELRPDEGRGSVHAVLTRRNALMRRAAGTAVEEQPLAANVDTAFVLSSLDRDLSLRRLERYLALIAGADGDDGIEAVILLTKADVCPDVQSKVTQVRTVAGRAQVQALSSSTRAGFEIFDRLLLPGSTVVLLGSSGVGKSTLANALIGSTAQATQSVREDDSKGRHTTTSRHMLALPHGALLIDTPGMRELRLEADATELDSVFAEITELATQCRFSNCGHESEPGCAIVAAMANGALSKARWQSYQKLQAEVAFQERKRDKGLMAAEKEKWKQIHRQLRQRTKR